MESRDSIVIKAELQKAKKARAVKVDERDELAKRLEVLDAEIEALLYIKLGSRTGQIAELEKELHLAELREYVEQLPKPVLTLISNKWDKSDYRVEKVTAKRIYITAVGGNGFYVSRDGSDRWAKEWGLDIPATITLWEDYQVNNSSNRKPA